MSPRHEFTAVAKAAHNPESMSLMPDDTWVAGFCVSSAMRTTGADSVIGAVVSDDAPLRLGRVFLRPGEGLEHLAARVCGNS